MLRWRFKRDLALGLSFLCLSAAFITSGVTSAIDGDIEVEVGILPMLTITTPTRVRIVLEPGGPATVAEMPVYIATNNQTGLHAAIALDKVSDGVHDTVLRSLVNEIDANYMLEPLEESIVNIRDFPIDRWGCTFAEDMRYEGLNTSDKPTIRYLTHNPSANEKRTFLCAARASKFQVAGLYSNTIMMTAVPNVIPDTISTITYMQEINETVIASMETDQSYQLVDGRDKKIYWVTKLRDGRVYMSQNLDYDLEAKTDGSELNEWGNLYPENSETAYDEPKSKLYKDGGNLVFDVDTNTYIDSSTLAFNSEKRHYHIGSFYNIEASNRSIDDNGDEEASFFDASGYCPFSWTVPGSLTTANLFGADFMIDLESAYYSDIVSTLYLAPMGYIDTSGNLVGVGETSYYIGNARSSAGRLPGHMDALDSRTALTVGDSYSASYSFIPDTQGGFIRCMAVPGRRYAIVFKNASNSVDLGNGSKPEFEQATMPDGIDVTTYDTEYSFNTNTLTPENIPDGYTFLGWTTDENSRTKATVTGAAKLGSTQEVITASDQGSNEIELTLFPAWEHNYAEPVLSIEDNDTEIRTINDITYMQDITPKIVSNTPYNTIKQLIDNRDNKRYWVRKLADGNLWMEQNLDLSFDEPRTLTPEDTNTNSTITLSNSDESVYQSHSGEGLSLSVDDVNYLVEDSQLWRNVFGSKYNRYTLLAGSDEVSEDTGDYSESICPRGWRLPSASNVSDVFYRDNYSEKSSYLFSGTALATATPPNKLSATSANPDLIQVGEPAISYTQNLSSTGVTNSNYSNYADNSYIRGTGRDTGSSSIHTISIPGATELHVEVYHNGESCCDYFYVYQGDNTNIMLTGKAVGSSSDYGIHDYGNVSYYVNKTTVVVPGDTVSFGFKSDSGGNGYGYYAIVTGYAALPQIEGEPLIVFRSFNQTDDNYYLESLNARCVASGKKAEEKTLQHISTMQEMRPSICAATPVGTEVQLKDTRDDQTYFVRKMSDGKCWMVQNLAYGKVRSNSLTSLSTDLLDKVNVSYVPSVVNSNIGHLQPAIGKSDDVVTIEYGYPIAQIDDIPINSYFRKYYSGIYYNYSAASLGLEGLGSICPRGWRLPTGNDTLIPDENFSREELGEVYTNGEKVEYNGKVYLTSTFDEENHIITLSDGSQVDADDAYLYPVRCLAR